MRAGRERCGGIACSSEPVWVPTRGSVVALAAGFHLTCARTREHGQRCWGRNHRGQLGRGEVRTSDDDPRPQEGSLGPARVVRSLVAEAVQPIRRGLWTVRTGIRRETEELLAPLDAAGL